MAHLQARFDPVKARQPVQPQVVKLLVARWGLPEAALESQVIVRVVQQVVQQVVRVLAGWKAKKN